MLVRNLDSVDSQYLYSLCGSSVAESNTLEFKRQLPGNSDKEKQELLKDVAAFANADGGDLVFGIEEKNGCASQVVPITSETLDDCVLRISQTIESGIEPRIPNIRALAITAGEGFVLVIRVPASFVGPHSVRVNNARRFVMRIGAGVSDLSFDQLRYAFDRTASLAMQARALIAQRMENLRNQRAPASLAAGPIATVHLVILSGLARRHVPDLEGIYASGYNQMFEPNWRGGDRQFNLDGVLIHPGGTPENGHVGYVQIFRDGSVEATSLSGREFQERQGTPVRKIIWEYDLAAYFRERTITFLNLSRAQGFVGPAVLSFGLLHVAGYELDMGSGLLRRTPLADRPHLQPPEAWIDDLESSEVNEVIRNLTDIIWQAFGIPRCKHYDQETGEFRTQQR